VDCDKIDEGCNGGLPSNAYEAIQKLGGLETEDDYPYEGRGESCHFNKSEVRATVTGGLNITTNETAIAQWLVKNGPISIGINAAAMQVCEIYNL
jgi:cathepsin F